MAARRALRRCPRAPPALGLKTRAPASRVPHEYAVPPAVPPRKWSVRLDTLARMVGAAECAVDVGCDHGWLAIGMASRGIAKRCIAVDVNRRPLDVARRNLEGCADRLDVQLRLGNGLAPVEPGEAGVAVMAGFGVREMCAALDAARARDFRPPRLVLNPPAKHAPHARRWLAEHGYAIDADACVVEGGTLHVAMAATFVGDGADTSLDYDDLLLGPHLRRDADHPHADAFQALVDARLRGLDAALRVVPADGRGGDEDPALALGAHTARAHSRRRQKTRAELERERVSLLAHVRA